MGGDVGEEGPGGWGAGGGLWPGRTSPIGTGLSGLPPPPLHLPPSCQLVPDLKLSSSGHMTVVDVRGVQNAVFEGLSEEAVSPRL